nr:hypothetical protein B0A51_02451 [Rachicladosporium sp. CCFEE 5018]
MRILKWPPLQALTLLGLGWFSHSHGMTDETISHLRQDTRDLFYHGYSNYMKHAFPEDELRPISCKPQTRNREDPADIGLNDVLGNYSVTLVDSLSTLAILASGEESQDGHSPLGDFQAGVIALVNLYGDGGDAYPCGSKACGFDLDSKVQVFETNIRGVGGLLSAHLFAVGELPIRGYDPEVHEQRSGVVGIDWEGFVYNGQLLRLAHDLASRLLPAFDTATGIPYPRVNLRYGIPFYRDSEDGVCRLDGTSTESREITENCAAGAGSLVLEFTTLSRLTGDMRFERLAKNAFWAVFQRRSAIGLIGNGIDSETGQWTLPPLAGIGAGVDSFFEYALKSSIMFSGLAEDEESPLSDTSDAFLQAWEQAHSAVKRHVHRITATEKYPYYGQADLVTGAPRFTWIDNLSAYYPGLLTLAGELDEAIESHLLFAALWTRYGALPERWHTHNAYIDHHFKHWAGRPEFIESTYYLYQATKDDFYLHVGEMTLRDIRRRCWTRCGWADLGDVTTGEQRDRMESFFLGETAKYLYLLFDQDHPLNHLDASIVFTTEGHPLIIPSDYRSASTQSKPSKTTEPAAEGLILPAPTCPVHRRSAAFTGSSIVDRPDFFHAAAMAQLHLVPVEASRSSHLQPTSEHSAAITIEDIRSPTNYTYYPWTLPQSLVPSYGFSAPTRTQILSTLTFTNLNTGDLNGAKGIMNLGALQKIVDGIVISSLSNLRLSMVQEPKSLILPNGDGLTIELDMGQQYRVSGVANWALGKDEKVVLSAEAQDGVAPGDPNFKRVKDLEMLDLVIDFTQPALSNTDANKHEHLAGRTNAVEGNRTFEVHNALDSIFDQILPLDPPVAPATPPQPILMRTLIPAILPTGPGAAPLPLTLDTADPLTLQLGQLPHTSIYFLDSTLCDHRLPFGIVRSHQILVIKRGGCSFSTKLANIPAFAASPEALHLVIVMSTPESKAPNEGLYGGHLGSGLIKPLLDEMQRTPAGVERRVGIAMVMVDGNDEHVAALRSAACVVAKLDDDGSIIEDAREALGTGLGVKRRYWFESMGVPIGNMIAL